MPPKQLSVPAVFYGKQLHARFYRASPAQRPWWVRIHRLVFATYAAGMREHAAAKYFRDQKVPAADIAAVKTIRRKVKNAYYSQRGRRRRAGACAS